MDRKFHCNILFPLPPPAGRGGVSHLSCTRRSELKDSSKLLLSGIIWLHEVIRLHGVIIIEGVMVMKDGVCLRP